MAIAFYYFKLNSEQSNKSIIKKYFEKKITAFFVSNNIINYTDFYRNNNIKKGF